MVVSLLSVLSCARYEVNVEGKSRTRDQSCAIIVELGSGWESAGGKVARGAHLILHETHSGRCRGVGLQSRVDWAYHLRQMVVDSENFRFL